VKVVHRAEWRIPVFMPVNKTYLQHRVNCAPSVGHAEEKSHMLRYDVSRFHDFLAIHRDGAIAHT
jgi:hypothetical protein